MRSRSRPSITQIPARRRSGFTAADHYAMEAAADVLGRASPESRPTVEELGHYLISNPRGSLFVATLDSTLAGCATAAPAGRRDYQFTMVRVLPQLRQRGVGAALLSAACAHAAEIGLGRLWGRIDVTDRQSLRFAERYGFTESGREFFSALDVTKGIVPAYPPHGVMIVSLAERPDLLQQAYEVERECLADVPAPSPLEPTSYERWISQTVGGSGALMAGTMVALAGRTAIGFAGLRKGHGQTSVAEHQLTCVRRSWRGKGVATAMKWAQIEWARTNGLRQLRTSNDSPNATMIAVNARLGYEPIRENVIVERTVTDVAPGRRHTRRPPRA